VTKENASIVATSVTVSQSKKLAMTDMESLKAELFKDHNDQCDSTIMNLLNLTHEQRRLQIKLELLEDFPFFMN